MCAVCNGVTELMTRRKIANDDLVCKSCMLEAKLSIKETFQLKNMTADFLKDKINNMDIDDPANFNATKKIGSHVAFDDRKKKWAVLGMLGTVSPQDYYDYSDVVTMELIEDGRTLNQGGLGRALVGGVLFGGAGAVVGAVTRKSKDVCKNLQVKITVNDMSKPAIFITFINNKTKKDSAAYKVAYQQAQECLSAFQVICDSRNTH